MTASHSISERGSFWIEISRDMLLQTGLAEAELKGERPHRTEQLYQIEKHIQTARETAEDSFKGAEVELKDA